jgi:hypothetical protein
LADRRLQNLVKIGGRIGADQKRSLALVSQQDRRGTRKRGFADTALAGEKEVSV